MKALVLCAGYGTRLGELTREIPKPMLPIKGEPLLSYTLSYLARSGISQAAINLHYKPEVIRDYFGDGSSWGIELHYSYEDRLLGTAGTVKSLQQYFSDTEDFLVVYGDLLINQNIKGMVALHRQKHAIATLLLHQRVGANSLVRMEPDKRISGFVERPEKAEYEEQSASHIWVNSGLQLLNCKIWEYISVEESPVDLPRDVYMNIVNRESIYGFPLDGYRCAIDSPERYSEAENAVLDGRYALT
jgi:NDP-sugar pyrophosphorylase family protein